MTSRPMSFFRWTRVLAAAMAALLLVSAAIAFYILVVRVPHDLAVNTAHAIEQWFQVTPRTLVQETVIIEQNAPILEVATVSRTMFVDYTWNHTWLGSTKTLQVTGIFTAKAGFDLREPFQIVIEKNPLRVVASLPPPRLLSVQMDTLHVLREDSGWWNRLSPGDREQAVNAILQSARTRAAGSGILEEVKKTAEERIRSIVEANGSTVQFQERGVEK